MSTFRKFNLSINFHILVKNLKFKNILTTIFTWLLRVIVTIFILQHCIINIILNKLKIAQWAQSQARWVFSPQWALHIKSKHLLNQTSSNWDSSVLNITQPSRSAQNISDILPLSLSLNSRTVSFPSS